MQGSNEAPTEPSDTTPAALAPGTRRALWLAILGIAAYVVLDVVAQLLPPHYSPISQAESDLAVGPYGYVMTINFVVRGSLTFAFLVGVLQATRLGHTARGGVALLAVWGAGAFILAAFPTDVGTAVTVHGTIHNLTAAVAFAAGAFGTQFLAQHFGAAHRLRDLETGARILGVLAVVMLFVTLASLALRRLSLTFGLVERVFIGLVLLWMLVVALQLLRSDRGARPMTAL